MTLPSKDTMADSVQERVGSLEQEMHTVRYQLNELHKIPPRVTSLERVVDVMTASLSHIEKDNAEIKEMVRSIHEVQSKHSGDMSGLSAAVKLGTGLMGFAAIGTAFVIWLVAL